MPAPFHRTKHSSPYVMAWGPVIFLAPGPHCWLNNGSRVLLRPTMRTPWKHGSTNLACCSPGRYLPVLLLSPSLPFLESQILSFAKICRLHRSATFHSKHNTCQFISTCQPHAPPKRNISVG